MGRQVCRMMARPLVVAALINSSMALQAAPDARPESTIKAAFLFHFAEFVEWPEQALPPNNSPLQVCAADEGLRDVLEASVAGKQVRTHPIHIRYTKGSENLQGCHILYVGSIERRQMSALLAAVKDTPVLTVGESADFPKEGGMIGFLLQNNKIRFDINLTAAQKANLKVSARLLILANSVIGG
ncbi:MAG TPA: YfiR family protein [Candidatus Acidoferrales bacterium]|nr:YfiR family protein [Candidatus Acidoferrales bacterium]